MQQYNKYPKEKDENRDRGDFHILSIPGLSSLSIKQQDEMLFPSLHLCYQANEPRNVLTLLDIVKQDLCLTELLPWQLRTKSGCFVKGEAL